jgi:hypothetical protein
MLGNRCLDHTEKPPSRPTEYVELGGSSWRWLPASGDGGGGVGRSTDGGHPGAVAPALASSITAADHATVLGVVRTGPGDGPTVT